jgi:hypothetical protein
MQATDKLMVSTTIGFRNNFQNKGRPFIIKNKSNYPAKPFSIKSFRIPHRNSSEIGQRASNLPLQSYKESTFEPMPREKYFISTAYDSTVRPNSRFNPSSMYNKIDIKLYGNQEKIPILKWVNDADNPSLQPDCWKNSQFKPTSSGQKCAHNI